MQEEFSDVSNKSIWTLIRNFNAIVETLRAELPFDYLTPSWHMEDATDNFTIGIRGRWGDKYQSLTIYTHYLDEPPQPREMYPGDCCATGWLQISSSQPGSPEALEVRGTPERWMAHHNDKWIPLSASYVAFLLGTSQASAHQQFNGVARDYRRFAFPPSEPSPRRVESEPGSKPRTCT